MRVRSLLSDANRDENPRCRYVYDALFGAVLLCIQVCGIPVKSHAELSLDRSPVTHVVQKTVEIHYDILNSV